MNRRTKVIVWGLLILGGVVAGWRFSSMGRKQSLLLITLDTTRADRLGCYGYQLAKTPNLDRLASSGILYENAYTAVPITLPSHATMLTGLLPPEHGLRINGTNQLPDSVTTLTEILKRAGYRTGAFVSSLVLESRFGLDRGFDVYDDRMGTDAKNNEPERIGEKTISAAQAWLETEPEKPFFCWVHLYDPHEPYRDHPREFGDEFAGRPYDAELAYMDKQIGRLLAFTRKQGWGDRTVIVVAGDHGEGLGEHQESSHGYMAYNSTMRVPLILADPQIAQPGMRVSEPVSLVDIFPSILNQFRLPLPGPTSGKVLRTGLNRRPLTERSCYGGTEAPYLEGGWSPLKTWTTSRWKYIFTTRPELYDLQADPRELKNVVSEQPDEAARLEQGLSDFESQLKPRQGQAAFLTADEQQALASIGYTGGQAPAKELAETRRDIKDTIVYADQLHQCMHLIDRNDLPTAQRILEGIVEAVPDYPKAWGTLGICFAKQENPIRAEECYRRTLALDSNQNFARIALGRALLAQDRLQESREQFQAAVRHSPKAAEAHYFLGEVCRKLHLWDDAITAFKAAIELAPKLVEAQSGLADVEREVRQSDAATSHQ